MARKAPLKAQYRPTQPSLEPSGLACDGSESGGFLCLSAVKPGSPEGLNFIQLLSPKHLDYKRSNPVEPDITLKLTHHTEPKPANPTTTMAALLHQVRLRSVLPQPLRSRRNVLILVPICFYRDGYSCQESGSALLKKRHLSKSCSLSAKASCAFRRMDCVPPTSARSRPFSLRGGFAAHSLSSKDITQALWTKTRCPPDTQSHHLHAHTMLRSSGLRGGVSVFQGS